MAEALLPIFFEVSRKKLVSSETSPVEVRLPTFHQEDGIPLSLMAVKATNSVRAPFLSTVLLTGYGLFVSVGTAGSVLASQNVFTLTADNKRLEGSVPLNTVGINALFAAATEATVTLELRLLTPSGDYYRGQFSILIKKAVATAAALVAPAGDRALGFLEFLRLGVRKEMDAGEGFIMKSQDSSARGFVYLHNDLSLHVDPIA